MTSYFEIRRRRKRPLVYPNPEPPKLERALLVDGDPRQAESQAWLDNYLKQKELKREQEAKAKERSMGPRLGDPPGKEESS